MSYHFSNMFLTGEEKASLCVEVPFFSISLLVFETIHTKQCLPPSNTTGVYTVMSMAREQAHSTERTVLAAGQVALCLSEATF